MTRPGFFLSLLMTALLLGACGSGGPKKVSEACTKSADCVENICHTGICCAANPAKNGVACNGAGDCSSLVCQGGRCAAGAAPAGSGCLHDEECATGRCSSGACGTASPDASPTVDRAHSGG